MKRCKACDPDIELRKRIVESEGYYLDIDDSVGKGGQVAGWRPVKIKIGHKEMGVHMEIMSHFGRLGRHKIDLFESFMILMEKL